MYLQIDNRNIHYQVEVPQDVNSDNVIILIHGLGQDLWSWNPIIPYLKNYRVIRYDLAGHGSSGIPSRGIFHMNIFADDLYQLIKHLGIKRATLYGYELGACIASLFTSMYPEYVTRLITVAHPVYYPDVIRQKIFEQRLQDIRTKGLHAFVRDSLPELTIRENCHVLSESYLNVSMNTYESVTQTLKNCDLSKIFNRVNRPVLNLVGELDDQYPPELMFLAMQYYPSSILVHIPQAKSLVHIDNPDYTAKRIDAFIRVNISNSAPLAKEASLYYSSLIKKRNEQTSHDYLLRVDCLHRFEARINGRLLSGNWKIRKAQELLICLVKNRVMTRERLYDLFWPHLNLENAQNMLRVSINHLKKLIDKPYGTSFIHSKRDSIELRGNVESDLLDLLQDIQAFHANRSEHDKELIARKIGQTVAPDMLDSYYNDWILNMRDELLNASAAIIKWIANHYESKNRLLDSILYYKQILKMLPDDIDLIEKIAKLYDELQLKGLAREWYERYARELQSAE